MIAPQAETWQSAGSPFDVQRTMPAYRRRSWAVAALILLFEILDSGDSGWGPSRWTVRVRRRDNGRVVLRFESRDRWASLEHAQSLRERAGSEDLWTFCRNVGIAFYATEDASPGA